MKVYRHFLLFRRSADAVFIYLVLYRDTFILSVQQKKCFSFALLFSVNRYCISFKQQQES